MSRVFDGTVSADYLLTSAVLTTWNPAEFTYTYSAWIFPTAWGASAGAGPGWIISSNKTGTGVNAPTGMFVTQSATGGGGTLSGQTNTKTTLSMAVSADSVLVLNRWHYVTYEYNTATLGSRLFIGGVEVKYKSQITGVGGGSSSANLMVGNDETSGTLSGFTGDIDSVAIWKINLTSAQIQAAMGYQGSGNVSPSNLLGYWPLLGTTNPEPSAYGSMQGLNVTGATQGSNSPGQTTPTTFPFTSYMNTAHYRKTQVIVTTQKYKNE